MQPYESAAIQILGAATHFCHAVTTVSPVENTEAIQGEDTHHASALLQKFLLA